MPAILALLLALLGPAPDSPRQPPGSAHPPLVISSMAGRDLYQFYCATCHGKDGKGSGPVVPALRQRPPDLTTMAARNGGTFPRDVALSLVTGGRELPAAHGSREMPVWGPIFHALDANDTANRLRIENVVDYLGSLQQK